MSSAIHTVNRIGELGAILVVRAETKQDALDGIRAVYEGGLEAIEITFTVPGAADAIAAVAKEFGEKILLGAGTVTTTEQAKAAYESGAKYLVAPNTSTHVIESAQRLGLPIFPGALTPTEVHRAWELGASAVKIFPASLGGPDYLKALKGPYPEVRMVPTGGVNEKTVAAWFDAGAFAVGAGGALFDLKLLKAREFGKMTETARRFVEAVRAARG
ncbi:MAG: bifunctional 4-hydroxy-2-oxoglutarate aldolase/2-dehydro-3-deoxy-phosphogluconate aldolase [Planctomycetota bacterium]|nr:bifunctional 4-hydroxy-2-oxoglutarate aldolase/2-dehydro-3-deoxy-phosphogluconate aldolase [Planctomycetota bacterium]